MRKAITLLLLLTGMFAVTATAQSLGGRWSLAVNMNEADVYIDTTTIREVDNQISVWSFVIYKDPLIMNEVNEPVARVKSNYLFNTISDKYSTVGTLYYDANGRIVGEAANQRFGPRDRFAQNIKDNSTIDLIYTSAQNFLNGGGTLVDDNMFGNDEPIDQSADIADTPGPRELANRNNNDDNDNGSSGARVRVPPVSNMPLTPPPLTLGSGNDDDDESDNDDTTNDNDEPVNGNDTANGEFLPDDTTPFTYEDHKRNMQKKEYNGDESDEDDVMSGDTMDDETMDDTMPDDMQNNNDYANEVPLDEHQENMMDTTAQEEQPLALDDVPNDNRIILPDVKEEENDYPRSDPPQPLTPPVEEADTGDADEYTFTDEGDDEPMMTDEDDADNMMDYEETITTEDTGELEQEFVSDGTGSKGKRIYDPTTGEYVYIFDTAEDKTMKEEDAPRSDPPQPLTTGTYNPDNERNVTSTIFTDGNTFVVQVASFRRKSVAEGEVERLKNQGHDAFLTEANIPSKGGTWYRVRVGYFNTQQEARQAQRDIK